MVNIYFVDAQHCKDSVTHALSYSDFFMTILPFPTFMN